MDKIDVCLTVCSCTSCEVDEENCILAKAYLKNVPTTVSNQKNGDAECPNCNHHVYYFQKHCVECGQALKWEVANDRENR
jgi:hypothetical protein